MNLPIGACRFIAPPKALEAAGKTNDLTMTMDRQAVAVRVTTVERTLVDVLHRPELAGGVEEVLKSLDLVRYLDPAKVADYVELLDNRSLASVSGWWLEKRRGALGVSDDVLARLRARLPRSKHYALGAEPGQAVLIETNPAPRRVVPPRAGLFTNTRQILANQKIEFQNARMIPRKVRSQVITALDRQAAVVLLGPRQIGKTTLAIEIAADRPSLYLDLESPEDRHKLAQPALFLEHYESRLVVLDEIHRAPEIFQTLRGLIDAGRRRGHHTGRFLMLGSASMDLLRQSGESLAGRVEYVDMGPLNALELSAEQRGAHALWIRGGFPGSFLARNARDSLAWRKNFIRTYLERDIGQFAARVPAETLHRLWSMLAHNQGALLNASRLASGLAVTAPTVTRYIDLLVDLLLVRRLSPLHANVGKRLVKSPKVYVRDSGLLHALLDIESYEDLAGHPVVGASWEGHVIEQLLAAAPERTHASFYRTAAGAEVDLVLELPGLRGLWAIEIKRSLSSRPERGFHQSRTDINPDRSFVVHDGGDRFPLAADIEAINVRDLALELAAANA